ncbi:hypothetical protein [Arthrobacter sp.]|uniref:hypothetical protein n=1 Tax=Arthrobacter sp. TaxID=1667 RepID=UPI003A8C9C97
MPGTTWIFCIAGALGFVLGPALALALERGAAVRAARHRSWLAGRISTLLRAAGDLRAHGRADAAVAGFGQRDSEASSHWSVPRRVQAWGGRRRPGSRGWQRSPACVVAAADGLAGADAGALLAVVSLLR